MLKLLFTLAVFLAVALGLLALRMQRTELTAETARLRQEVDQRERRLWSQDVPIARETNPKTVLQGLKSSGLAPADPVPSATNNGNAGDADRDLIAPLRTGATR